MKIQFSNGVQDVITCLKLVKAFVYQKIQEFL